MCTATWMLTSSGYQIYFNRDEQKGRQEALPPTRFDNTGTEFVMPVDPVGGGSWIAMNEHGLSLCLLNFYQGKMPQHPLISRGLLIKQLANCRTAHEALATLDTVPLLHYAPFSLMLFDPTLTQSHGEVLGMCWNGISLSTITPQAPMVSSGVDLHNVTAHRQGEYLRYVEHGVTAESLRAFHASHVPRDELLAFKRNACHSHLSACMHRADAHTVSFTHIEVTPQLLTMNYLAGSLCDDKNCEKREINGNKTPTSSFLLVRKMITAPAELII